MRLGLVWFVNPLSLPSSYGSYCMFLFRANRRVLVIPRVFLIRGIGSGRSTQTNYNVKDLNTKAGKLVDEIEKQQLKYAQKSTDGAKSSESSYLKHLSSIIESENFQNLKKELSSFNERRQNAAKMAHKDFSERLDLAAQNLKTALKFASRVVNDVTGYTKIEQLKQSIVACESELQEIRKQVQDAKRAHEDAVSARVASQKEINSLLERKHRWSPEDLERFTNLYRDDHTLESKVNETTADIKKLENTEEETYSNLIQGIMNRYHEEQVWSDRIRSFSTWGTLIIMAVNLLLFVVVQLFLEPFKRSRMVNSFEIKIKELLDEKIAQIQSTSAADTMQPASQSTQSVQLVVPEAVVSFIPKEMSVKSIWNTVKRNLELILVNPLDSYTSEVLSFDKMQLNVFVTFAFASGLLFGIVTNLLLK